MGTLALIIAIDLQGGGQWLPVLIKRKTPVNGDNVDDYWEENLTSVSLRIQHATSTERVDVTAFTLWNVSPLTLIRSWHIYIPERGTLEIEVANGTEAHVQCRTDPPENTVQLDIGMGYRLRAVISSASLAESISSVEMNRNTQIYGSFVSCSKNVDCWNVLEGWRFVRKSWRMKICVTNG